MAKVEWADAIKTVSGALTRINKKSPHAGDQKMILGTHRKAATTNPDCSRIYFRGLSSITRSTPLSSREMSARQRFTAVAAAVKARANDINQITQDQIAFKAQKDQPDGKKTMKAYYWKVCGDIYDEAHNG